MFKNVKDIARKKVAAFTDMLVYYFYGRTVGSKSCESNDDNNAVTIERPNYYRRFTDYVNQSTLTAKKMQKTIINQMFIFNFVLPKNFAGKK